MNYLECFTFSKSPSAAKDQRSRKKYILPATITSFTGARQYADQTLRIEQNLITQIKIGRKLWQAPPDDSLVPKVITDAQLKRELRGYKPPKAGPLKRSFIGSAWKGSVKTSRAVSDSVDLRSIKRSYARS